MENLRWFFEMVDGLSGPARSASRNIRALNVNIKMVNGQIQQQAPAARRAGGGMLELASHLSMVGQGASMVIGGLESLGGTMVSLLASGGRMVYDAVTFRENMETSFEVLLGSQEAGRRVFQQATVMARTTPFDTRQVVNAFQNFATAGFAERDLPVLTAAVGEVAAARGMNAELIERLTTAMGQVRATGHLTGETMREFMHGGVGAGDIYRELAGAMHIRASSDAELATRMQHMISSGAVSSEFGIYAVVNAIRNRFGSVGQNGVRQLGGMMERQSHTFAGLMSTIQSMPQEYLQGLLDAPVMARAREMLSTLTDSLLPTTAAGQQLIATIGELVTGVMGQFLDQLRDAGGAGAIFGQIASFVRPLVPAVLGLVTAFRSLGTGLFRGLAQTIRPLLPLFASFTGNASFFESFGLVVGRVIGGMVWAFSLFGLGFMEVTNEVQMLLGGLVSFFGSAWTWIRTAATDVVSGDFWMGIGRSIVDGITAGLRSAWDGLMATFHELAGHLPEVVRTRLGIASPSRVFMELGLQTVAGFTQGVSAGASDASGAVSAAVAPPRLGRGGGSGGTTISNMFHIEVHTTGGDAQEIGHQVSQQTASAVAVIFEQIALETGGV